MLYVMYETSFLVFISHLSQVIINEISLSKDREIVHTRIKYKLNAN